MSDQSRQQPVEVPEKRISSQAGLAALRQGATLAGPSARSRRWRRQEAATHRAGMTNNEPTLHEEVVDSPTEPTKALVMLFKPSGKYYTEEYWRIPTREQAERHEGFLPGDMVTPYVMRYSPDFRRISGGAVLVVSQEPWGYPHLMPGTDQGDEAQSATELPQEVVEAAAEAIYASQTGTGGYRTSIYKENWDRVARRALMAAADAGKS